MSENLHAVAQQNNRPFVQVAAWIKRRTYRSRDFVVIHFQHFAEATLARIYTTFFCSKKPIGYPAIDKLCFG